MDEKDIIRLVVEAAIGGGVIVAIKVQVAVIKNDIKHIYHELERLQK